MIKLLLTLLSLPGISRLYGRIVRIRRPRFIVRPLIRRFAATYKISMKDYQGTLEDYPSLLDFFVRPLDPAARPLVLQKDHFVSPADGRLAELQKLDSDSAVQVKGWTYKLSQLTGAKEPWEKGWWLAVIYLSPSNYHRYHYPMDCRLEHLTHLGNRLFPVNQAGIRSIKNLFVRNERVTAGFRAGQYPFYVVAVGATFVGSIKMTAHPAPFIPGQTVGVHKPVRQNKQMGRFDMGSTLVILVPRRMADPAAEPGTAVEAGTPLFKLKFSL